MARTSWGSRGMSNSWEMAEAPSKMFNTVWCSRVIVWCLSCERNVYDASTPGEFAVGKTGEGE
jgi:hypothetical protein